MSIESTYPDARPRRSIHCCGLVWVLPYRPDTVEPRPPLRSARILSFVLFVALGIWQTFYAGAPTQRTLAELSNVMYQPTIPKYDNTTKVLIVRTVSKAEMPIVIDDIIYVKGFYAGKHEELMRQSRKLCPLLREAGYRSFINPWEMTNGSRHFPNHILCNSPDSANYYVSVRADFMLFARSEGDARLISETIDKKSVEAKVDRVRDVDIDIRDVSSNPKKIWSWLTHCDDVTLAGYDYVWLVDGDIPLTSLNWQAFWQLVIMLRPKITQASVIGTWERGWSTNHNNLRFVQDSRVIASETPIIEVQSPLLEVDTWLGYRSFLLEEPLPMEQFRKGGEQCFDMGWCHYAKNYKRGKNNFGRRDLPLEERYIGDGKYQKSVYQDFHRTLPLSANDVDPNDKGRGCVVLYQTPITHESKSTLNRYDADLILSAKALCLYFRAELGVIGKVMIKSIYDVLLAPPPQELGY